MPTPTVLLLHALPDGSSHIDWMIAVEPEGVEPLLTFRLQERLDELETGHGLTATRIADHRPAYLDYEGPVSCNRGTVQQLRRGELLQVGCGEPDGKQVLFEVIWRTSSPGSIHQQLNLRHREADRWSITCIAIHEVPAATAAATSQEES